MPAARQSSRSLGIALAVKAIIGTCCPVWPSRCLIIAVAAYPSIDVQKMNWKVRTGVQEQTGVCLHRHCDHHGTGGYTHEPQNTGQCCDCQSLTCQVAPGLSK